MGRIKMSKRAKAFTLTELLVSIAIIAILASLTIPSLLHSRVNANDASAIATLRTISTAQIAHRLHESNKTGTPTYGDLQSLVNRNLLDRRFSTTSSGASSAIAGYLFRAYPGDVPNNSFVWVATAEPVLLGKTGSRYYMINHTGQVWFASSIPGGSLDPTVFTQVGMNSSQAPVDGASEALPAFATNPALMPLALIGMPALSPPQGSEKGRDSERKDTGKKERPERKEKAKVEPERKEKAKKEPERKEKAKKEPERKEKAKAKEERERKEKAKAKEERERKEKARAKEERERKEKAKAKEERERKVKAEKERVRKEKAEKERARKEEVKNERARKEEAEKQRKARDPKEVARKKLQEVLRKEALERLKKNKVVKPDAGVAGRQTPPRPYNPVTGAPADYWVPLGH